MIKRNERPHLPLYGWKRPDSLHHLAVAYFRPRAARPLNVPADSDLTWSDSTFSILSASCKSRFHRCESLLPSVMKRCRMSTGIPTWFFGPIIDCSCVNCFHGNGFDSAVSDPNWLRESLSLPSASYL